MNINAPLAILTFFAALNSCYASTETQFDSVKKAAEAGDASAQYTLGNEYYLNGAEGVDKNYSEAKAWLEKSASQGFSDAYFPLGIMYSFGFGVEKDPKKAITLYQKAGAADNGGAYYNLAESYRQGLAGKVDEKQATKYYKLASVAGSAKAFEMLAWRYEEGITVAKNYKTAMSYYKKAADANLPYSQGAMGRFYDVGLGVKENNSEALKWYKKAADNGDVSSMNNLGVMYEQGEGTKRDFVLAKNYLEKAAEMGSPDALGNLGDLYINGKGVDKDLAKGSALYKESCDKGVESSCSKIKSLNAAGLYRIPNTQQSNASNEIANKQRLIAKSIDKGVDATLLWEGDNASFEAHGNKINCSFLTNGYKHAGQLATTFVCTDNVQLILKNFKDTNNSYLAVMTNNFQDEVKSFSVNVYVTQASNE